MSDEIIKTLLNVSGPLLGAIVGGLISSLTVWWVERQRWRRDRQEKLATLQREALAATLEWIEPMRNAQSSASSLIMATIQGNLDHGKFFQQFPNLLGELVKKDLPGNQRAVLPDDVYARGHRIVRELDALRILGVRYGQEAQVMGKPMPGLKECGDKLDSIDKQISELETDLRKAFRKTFD